jgi:hypothetical protein
MKIAPQAKRGVVSLSMTWGRMLGKAIYGGVCAKNRVQLNCVTSSHGANHDINVNFPGNPKERIDPRIMSLRSFDIN